MSDKSFEEETIYLVFRDIQTAIDNLRDNGIDCGYPEYVEFIFHDHRFTLPFKKVLINED